MAAGTEQTTAAKSYTRDAPQVLPPADQKQTAQSGGDQSGIYSRMREIIVAGGAQEPPPSNLAPIFRSAEFSHPANDEQKRRALQALQQNYGNHYVQRVLADESANPSNATGTRLIQRSESRAAPGSASPAAIGKGNGHPLDSRTQDSMGASFNQDFSGVRVHDDSASHQAARDLNARAFTTGRDIYFSPGAYNPNSDSGRKLLAHELTHVAQQSGGASSVSASGFSVSHPSDPLERQADQVSEAVMRGEMFPPISTSSTSVVHRVAPAAPSTPARLSTPASGASAPASGGGRGITTAGGTGAGTTPAAKAGDFSFSAAGMTVVLPIRSWLEQQAPGSISVPDSHLKKAAFPGFKLTSASLDLDENKIPNAATIGVALAVPPLTGDGTLTVDKNRNASGTAHVVFSPQKMPGLKQTTVDARITKDDFAFDAAVDFDLPKVTGKLQYKYQDHKHSGKGKANYEGSKMRGSIEIIMSEAGLISGSGMLDMELFKGLQGQANVAVDEKRNIAVQGKLTVPGEVVLFPEKKYEKSFFNFEKKFPIWGITIPVIDVNVGIFAEIHAGAGFRSKFGPGVLRGIELTGEFGTDPEAATEFGLGGEFYVPAAAEVVANVGGGIGLGLAIADITGGIEAIGVAGLYTALTVRPQFKYAGGKYTISGMAELGGVAQLKFGINAFAKIDVGVWLFKGTVWRKDWTLAEWVWNTGLNIALRANISYTLGDDFAPDISFETGQLDPEKFIKDAMPESGSPVPAPPKPPVPEKASFTAEGAQGTGTGAPGEAPAAPTPGAAPATTTPGTAPATGGPPVPDGGTPASSAPVTKDFALSGESHTLTATLLPSGVEITMASGERHVISAMLGRSISDVRADPTRSGEEKTFLINILTKAQSDERALHQDWIIAGARDPRGGTTAVDFPTFANVRLAQIVNDLLSLSAFGIKSFDQFLARTPAQRYLPGDYDVRDQLYERGSGWGSTRTTVTTQGKRDIKSRVAQAQQALTTNSATAAQLWNDLKREDKIPSSASINSFTPAEVDNVSYHVDHVRPLSFHWQVDGGNNIDDNDRWNATTQTANLSLITEEANLRKPRGRYVNWVGPAFTSHQAQGGLVGARQIDGRRFEDATQNPLP
jgi:hypothetical protein